jgi:hypothetical protein
MSKDLDQSLRSALRPVDPGEQFTRNVMAAIEQDSSRSDNAPAKPRTTFRWASAALTISLVVAVVTAHQWQVHRQERGLQARRQLIQALQLTGEKLDLAYRVVNDTQHPEPAP